jgi:hypothetical protein
MGLVEGYMANPRVFESALQEIEAYKAEAAAREEAERAEAELRAAIDSTGQNALERYDLLMAQGYEAYVDENGRLSYRAPPAIGCDAENQRILAGYYRDITAAIGAAGLGPVETAATAGIRSAGAQAAARLGRGLDTASRAARARALAEQVRGASDAAKGGVRTTAHGAERIAGQGATRGGVLSEAGVNAVRQGGRVMIQADGATVRILQNEAGRFNVVVEGERGIITTFENLSQKSLDRLAGNYGWK